MKFLLLPVICLLVSCAGNGTMTVVSKNSEGMTLSGEWRHHTMYATESAAKAQAWFAKEAVKLAQAEGKPVSSVQLQSATLKYRNFGGMCNATLRGAAYFGGSSSAGAGFYDGSSLMTQAHNEDVRVAKVRATLAAISAVAGAVGAVAAARTAQIGQEMEMQRIQMAQMPRYTSPPITVPTLTHTDMYAEMRNFHVNTPHMTYNMPQTKFLSVNGSGSARPSIPTFSSTYSPRIPTYSSAATTSRIPTYSPSNNMGLSSGLATRSGQLSGNTYYHPNGTTSTKQGNTWFHPGGTTTTRVGNTITSSTGATSKKQGNTWFHSNGKTSTQTGNTIHNSDGTSYTISPSGTMYLNGKGL